MNTDCLPARLVYHPLPMLGEGLNGYMLRLAEGNHFAGINDIIKRGSSEILELSHRLGIAADDIALEPLARQSANAGRSAYLVWNNQTSRYCPECLQQHDLWPQEWELALLTVCPQHGCRLISDCHHCGNALNWKRQRRLHCDCGAALKYASSESTNQLEKELAASLVASYARSSQMPEHLSLMSIVQLHHLVVFIGAYAQDTTNGKRMKISRFNTFQTAWSITQSAATVLMDWPSGFYRLLDCILASRGEKQTSTKLSVKFGAFYHYLFKTFKGAEYGFVTHAFEGYLEKNWTNPLANRNRCLSPTLRRNHTWVPANVLAKELKTSRVRLLRLHDEGRIAGHLTRTPSGRTTFCVDRREIPLMHGLLHDLVDMRTACQILGVSKARVAQLAEHALLGKAISPNKSGYGQWGLSRKYLEAMPLFGGEWIPVNEDDHPNKVSLAFALKYLLNRKCLFPRLVIAVVEEKILPCGFALGRIGIARWLFDRAELASWIDIQNKGFRDGAMSIVEAAQELNLKQEVAYYLIHRGVLNSYIEEDTKQTFVRTGDIEQFKRTYILTSEIASRMGVPRASTVPRRLNSIGIKPYLDPSIDLCRQYIYQRTEELERLIDERLIIEPKKNFHAQDSIQVEGKYEK